MRKSRFKSHKIFTPFFSFLLIQHPLSGETTFWIVYASEERGADAQ